jgi:hypothetical protein
MQSHDEISVLEIAIMPLAARPRARGQSPTGNLILAAQNAHAVQAFVHEIDAIARWRRRTSFRAFGF